MKSFIYIAAIFALSACTSSKNSDNEDAGASLTETRWSVAEINGKTLSAAKEGQKDAYMILKKETSNVEGNSGCNRMAGKFDLKENNRLSFSQIISTKMACADPERMESETQLLKAIEMTDSYIIIGDTLQLLHARMAPLAKFVAKR